MSRPHALPLLVAILTIALTASFVLAIDGTPDKEPVTSEDVDPDGLEGIQGPTGRWSSEVLFKTSPQSQLLLMCILQYARVIGF